MKIFFAFEAFAWAELLEVARNELLFLVAPACHVLLPHGYLMVRVEWITVGLCIGVGVAPVVIGSCLEHALPPMVDAAIAFFKVILAAYHGVEEELPTEAVVL